MASAPASPRVVPALVITAAEWEAMLIEDPQASPDWQVAWPYGSWRRRLSVPGPVRELPAPADRDPPEP